MAETNRIEKKATGGKPAAAKGGVTPYVVRQGEAPPEPSREPVKDMPAYEPVIRPLDEHQTVADKIDFLNVCLESWHEIKNTPDGGRAITLHLEDGTSVGGKGKDTAEAFNSLLERINQFGLLTDEVLARGTEAATPTEYPRGDEEDDK